MTWLVAWQLLKRFWPVVVVLALAGVVAGGVLRIQHLERKVEHQKVINIELRFQIEQYRDAVAKLDEVRAAVKQCEAQLKATVITAEEWEHKFRELRARPPEVRVEIRDRIVGTTAAEIASEGARIACELAAGIAERRASGAGDDRAGGTAPAGGPE